LYSAIPIKGIPLLTFRNDPDEPMIENSSGTVKSGFWNPVYQNDCEGYLHPEDAGPAKFFV
jgi:hypothetical protein